MAKQKKLNIRPSDGLLEVHNSILTYHFLLNLNMKAYYLDFLLLITFPFLSKSVS